MRLPKLAKEFCSHFFEKTISTYDKHMGEIETISVKDQSIRWYMSLSADFADQTLLEALPLSVAYMLGDFYDGALGSYAFNVYCAEFSRFSAGAGLNTQHLLGVCGEYAHQLPSILNTLTELRSGDDDYETIAEAVGILREAIAGIVGDATSSHWIGMGGVGRRTWRGTSNRAQNILTLSPSQVTSEPTWKYLRVFDASGSSIPQAKTGAILQDPQTPSIPKIPPRTENRELLTALEPCRQKEAGSPFVRLS